MDTFVSSLHLSYLVVLLAIQTPYGFKVIKKWPGLNFRFNIRLKRRQTDGKGKSKVEMDKTHRRAMYDIGTIIIILCIRYTG